MGAEGGGCRLVPLTKEDARRCGSRSGCRARRRSRRAHHPGALGHHERRRRRDAGDRVRRTRIPDAAEHRPRHPRADEVHRAVADQQSVLVEARWVAVSTGRDDHAADAGADAATHGRGRARGKVARACGGHRRGARSLLLGRHRARDGGVSARARRAVRRQRFQRVLRAARGTCKDDLPRLHRLQARVRQPGPGAAAGAEHPRDIRPPRDGLRQRRLPAHRDGVDEARLCRSRQLLRRPIVRDVAGCCRRRMPRSAPRSSIRGTRRGRSSPAIR